MNAATACRLKKEARALLPMWAAMVYVGARDFDKTFFWLERAFDEPHELARIRVWPHFDLVREDPRFKQLMRRLDHEQAAAEELLRQR